MRKSNQIPLRALLRECSDGLTVSELAHATGLDEDGVNRSLKCMPDAYIDRWQTVGRRKYYSAVWCVVVPPENCPKPERKPK
jgi:DNA-binding transcriptional regulator GbsR (MarR family)